MDSKHSVGRFGWTIVASQAKIGVASGHFCRLGCCRFWKISSFGPNSSIFLYHRRNAIAARKQNWYQYLIGWNQRYFEPALSKALQDLPAQTRRVTGDPCDRILAATRRIQSATLVTKDLKPMAYGM
ncbi:MAG: hypothetical protein WCD18_25380 [Thermosynechococcaceae cyanobacterium]